jgi:hypothetical protein
MILKASQRAGGKQLAAHLLNAKDNEHVQVHELRGFMADDLHGALAEAYAASKGTRAKQFLFSLSLNPPSKVQVRTEVFETAIERIEQRLGLTGQPRAIVFHEKDGRRHAHAVWSRIDTEHMRAVNLSHYKLKLRDIARELYLEHGWQMPRGFVNSKERNPFNCSLKQWQQMRRAGHDRNAIQQMFRECWAISDSGKAFAQALKARGYTLARGDRRGHVAVDYRGEVYAIAKYAGIPTKQVRDRLGDPARLPSVEETSREVASRMSALLKAHIEQAEKANRVRSAALKFQYTQVIQRQRDERSQIQQAQELRWNAENAERTTRLSKGFRGIWDRLTGKHGEIKRQNEREALLALQRDRSEMDALIFRHIEERERLQQRVRDERKSAALEVQRLHRDIAAFMERRPAKPPNVREQFRQATGQRKDFSRGRDQSRDRDFEPDM